jgi:branched-chain amino acid transport system permease protein
MSTIGVTFMIEGGAQMLFGSDVYPLRLFPTDAWFLFEGSFPGGILVSKIDVWGGMIAAVLVVGLALFFQQTKTGRALRAVADDHAAAQSVGISLNWIWFIVWLVAGLVALVAATVWGTKLGVQFSITFLALKALPVLIIGGFTSVPGAIVGGLIVGAGEKLAEAYLGPFIGGGIEYWFAYVLALVVLLARPQGLFGERIIERI